MSALDDVRRALTQAYGAGPIFDGLTVDDLVKALVVDEQLAVSTELRDAADDLGQRVRAGGPRARGLAFARTILIARANGERPASPRASADHRSTAEALREQPRTWLPVSDYPSRDSARSVAWSIHRGRYLAYRPDRAFEARLEPPLDGYRVFARFVGTARKDTSS